MMAIIGEASIVISVVIFVAAHAAAGASIISTSVEGGIGEGGVVNLGSPLSAIPGKVVMPRMPIAGVAAAGINVGAAAREYVTATGVVVVWLGIACCN